jgi:hypothetical protein
MGVHKPVAAPIAFAAGIIFKKFDGPAAFRAFGLKYGAWLPVATVLSRTFHDKPP